MARFVRQRAKAVGQAPGTLVHTGERKVVRITVLDYNEDDLEERVLATPEEAFGYLDSETVTWINVDGLHQVDVVEKLGTHFGLHPLVLEDVMNTGQRPKMEDYETYAFLVVRMLAYDDARRALEDEQVSLVLGRNFVLSFQERVGDIFDPVRERLRAGKGRLRKAGADYLAYALLDALVDHYFVLLERFGERLEEVEEELIEDPTTSTLHAIHELKREMIFLRRSIWPLREVINRLQRGESELVREGTLVYLRDVYDHTIQVIDTVESQRDMVAGMLDTYLSSVSNRMNEVMKVLTIIATIFIPLGFVAGLYGMNFTNMPELGFAYGYFIAVGVMAATGVAMALYFRRKGWF